MDQNLIGVVVASVVGVIGRLAVPSKSERIRSRLIRTLDARERTSGTTGLDLVTSHLDRTMEIQSASLLEAEWLATQRRFDASSLFYSLLLSVAFGYGAYLLWQREDWWWKTAAVILGIMSFALVASGIESAFKKKADGPEETTS